MRFKRQTVAIYLVAFVVLIDQMSKFWVYSTLMRTRHTVPLTSFLRIELVMNKGVTFGFFNDLNPTIMPMILTGAALTILVLLGRWLWRTSSLFISLCLGAIMGGAIGNVIDRIHYGAVVDFIDLHIGDIHYPWAFNIADAAIVTGVIFLALDGLVRGR